MKKTFISLLVALMATTGARADYGWYDGSMTIGGVTTDCTSWSTDGNNPTDLGYVSNLTVTSVAFNVWSDGNDRDGANMFFRIWDGDSEQVGSDQDLWLGSATRIEGKAHDFAISWTGTLDLASAVGLTLVPGKTYYVDMYAKTYGNNRDEWYSNNSANFHAKLTYASTTTSGIIWNVASNSGTFTMPAYNVEVNTELWYRLEEDADNSDLKAMKNVFLERTLQTGGWNTFSAPFDIDIQSGWTVKKLTGSDFDSSTKELTLTFDDETTKIEAGKPYLIKVDAAYDFTADGHEFEGVTQDYTARNAETTYADFVPAMDRVNLPASQDILFVSGGNELTYPTSAGYMKGFRAYFKLADGVAGARAFRMSFGDEETGIMAIDHSTLNNEHSIYDLQGRKFNGQSSMANGQLKKGVYIINGNKTVIK